MILRFLNRFLDNLKAFNGKDHINVIDTYIEFDTKISSSDMSISDVDEVDIQMNTFFSETGAVQLKQVEYTEISKYGNENTYSLDKNGNVIAINLCGSGVSDISAIEKYSYLKFIDLRVNKINNISFINNLQNLEYVYLNYNNIKTVNIKEKSCLKEFTISHNHLQEIIIENCPLLNKLALSSKVIPSNRKSAKSIFLRNLPSLKTLNFSGNSTEKISLCELPNLEYLDISNNRISDVSNLKGLKHLKELKLNKNKVKIIKPLLDLNNLQKVNLSHNLIEEFSIEIFYSLYNLNELNISSNPIPHLPKEIFNHENSVKHVFTFLKDLEKGAYPNNEVKVIFIGNGSVGKTQVAKRIAYQKHFVFDELHDSTHGITLLRRHLESENLELGLQLNLWDFAGQDIYHATHRLFMQTQALFILVWDIINENSISHSHNGKLYQNEKLSYWLEYANFFGKKSPIIIVQNKIDRDCSFDEKLPTTTENHFRETYKIADIMQVSAKTAKGFFLLEKAIIHSFENDITLKEEILIQIPLPWVNIREQLREWQKESIKEISVDKLLELCENEGVGGSLNSIMLFFNDTGVFYYKEGYFNNSIILNQSWAIEAIYKILDRDTSYYQILEHNKGVVFDSDLEVIWKGYSKDEKKIFIDFMLSCELCFGVGKSLVFPQMLPFSKSKELELLETHLSLSTVDEILYRFLPSVFLHRFIIRANRFARVENMWQYGILLEHESMFALVEADYKNKTIIIKSSRGSEKMVRAIKEELNKINSEENKIKAQHRKEGFDALLFGEAYLKKIYDLSNNHNIVDMSQIKTLIAANNVSESIKYCIALAKDSDKQDLLDDILVISARFSSNEKQRNNNLISDTKYKLEHTKIISALLNHIKQHKV